VGVRSIVLVHNKHRPLRTGCDIAGDTSGYQASEPGTAVRAEDDEARCVVLGGVNDPLPYGRSLDRDGLRPESGCISQRGSVCGGLLGSLPDLVAACCVELRARIRKKPNVERMPHGDDERFAIGRQLVAGLGYGGPRQIGAVVGEQDGTEPVTALAARLRARAE
jgi:hypothetical protein